jgi:protocatechuate 3,4-dioxygenase beta subunit
MRITSAIAGSLTAALLTGAVLGSVIALRSTTGTTEQVSSCHLTPFDVLGPYYKSGSPRRETIASGGLLLTGILRSWPTCSPIPNAQIELWEADENGTYPDTHRGYILTDDKGRYRVDIAPPGRYEQRPEHIHIRIQAAKHLTLVTQLYPDTAKTSLIFDLTLLSDEGEPPAGFTPSEPSRPLR